MMEWSPEDEIELAQECAELDAAYAASEADALRADAELRDPVAALAFLQECHGGDDCDGECPAPVAVLEVLEASSNQPSMLARVTCADGSVRTVRAWYSYCHATFWEPPDTDVGYVYE